MIQLDRITTDPAIMGGKSCIRGLRVTTGTLVGLVASGKTFADILALYSYIEPEDISQALRYAALRAMEIELP